MSDNFKKNIEDLLFQKGTIDNDKLNTIKVEVVKNSINPQEYLLSKGWATEGDIVAVTSEAYGIPFVNLEDEKIEKDAMLELTETQAKEMKAIPFAQDDKIVKVAMADPFDLRVVQFIQNKFEKKVEVYIALPTQLSKVIADRYGQQIDSQVNEAVQEVRSEGIIDIGEGLKDIRQVKQEISQNSSIARIINMILEYAVKSRASDVHIETMEKTMRVRYRINGMLITRLDDLPISIVPALVSRIKIMSKLKIDEKRIPQDGRMQIRVDNNEVDLRVSTLPTSFGEKVVIRILERSAGIPDISKSGLRGTGFKLFVNALSSTRGIVLITGPTGSGKTRTLASSLAKINKEDVNIVTLEDPVEIRIPGVNQVQVNPDAGLTFASGLRSILRQDPDIVMVGEIRDEETARLATQASLTGHLVLATLHTNSAAGALPRMLDMNIEPYLISSTVNVVVAQSLVRSTSRECNKEYDAPIEVVKDIHKILEGLNGFDLYSYPKRDFPNNPPGAIKDHDIESKSNAEIQKQIEENKDKEFKVRLYKPVGCDKCGGSGYSGRIGIFEVLQVSDKIATMIMEHRSASSIHKQAKEDGMIDMMQDGYMKALDGITTIEEILRVSKG